MSRSISLLGLLIASLWLLGWTSGDAQGFTITHFHADLYLRLDGSFRVEETINVNFSEQKHGIFRAIPFRYSTLTTESTLAQGRVVGKPYQTFLDSLYVDQHEFTVSEEGDYKKLRIGSADSYVTGRQQYKISYVVFGAINRFVERDELYWNVNGNEWPASADTISILVHLPDPKLKLVADQCKVFTGVAGARGTDADFKVRPGQFEARSTRRLAAYEGITIGLALPKKLLKHRDPPLRSMANFYYFDSVHTSATLHPNGSITVEEYLVVDYIQRNAEVYRYLPGVNGLPGLSTDTLYAPLPGRLILESAVKLLPNGRESGHYASVQNSPDLAIIFGESTGNSNGRETFIIRYTVWEASHMYGNKMVYYLPWLGNFHSEPVRAASIEVKWPTEMRPVEKGAATLSYETPAIVSEFGQQGAVAQLGKPNIAGEALFLAFMLEGPGLKSVVPPMRLTGSGTYHDLVEVDMTVEENGRLRMQERIYLSKHDRPALFFNRQLFVANQPGCLDCYDTRSPTLFGNRGAFLCGAVQCNTRCERNRYGYDEGRLELSVPLNVFGKDSTFLEYQYWLYGSIKSNAASTLLHIPLIGVFDEPVERVRFRVRLPSKPTLGKDDYRLSLGGGYSMYPITLDAHYADGVLSGEASGLAGGQSLDLWLQLPPGTVSWSGWLEFRMFVQNQTLLCCCIALSLLLAVIWFVWGRDKRFTLVPAFLPPDDLTPAEAGLLFDGHLHNRDILSLIYYWGAKGHLKIEEISVEGVALNNGVIDYRLVKLKPLPTGVKGAKDFELHLFNGLFEKKDVVQVSSLNQKFYLRMAAARTMIEAHATTKGYFEPGTIAFSRLAVLSGFAVSGVTLVWLMLSVLRIMSSLQENSDLLLGLGILGGALIGFGVVMPKHGPFGRKRYQALMGFREFLDKAERDRLRLLQDENPAYFGLTLSYAIGLGMANRWVDKFGPLLTVAPSYYKSTGNSTFDAADFNLRMSLQLSKMATNFTSSPPPPPSSGGGGGSSWSGGSSGGSSYRSSSSYSGGGGSYSSGGSSGGGFGGGGGGSW
jgi:uncharacterized membrane protein YgcG